MVLEEYMAAKKSAKPAPRPTAKTPEDVLRDYFLKEDLTFLYKEKKFPLPPGAPHEFLLPDFYLPQLGLPVEIMHHWDDPKFRPRNLAKSEAYSKADIPCIFIYPKDLQALDKIFAQKLQEAKRHLMFQQRDKQEINFSLMVAIVCILLGIPLAMTRYTKYLGWIAIAYGATLLLMRHPHLVLAVLKKTGHLLHVVAKNAGHLLLVFLAALGRGIARLSVFGWHAFTILCRLLWKLTKLFAIYAWIAIRAIALAIWWIIVRIWFGFLTAVIWLWHAFIWLCTRIWRGIQWLSVHGFRSIGIGLRYLWIATRAAAKMLVIAAVYFWRGFSYLCRNIWRGFLVALQAFGSGIYRAKHTLQEKAKERKQAAREVAKIKREEAYAARETAKTAQKPKPAKRKKRKAA